MLSPLNHTATVCSTSRLPGCKDVILTYINKRQTEWQIGALEQTHGSTGFNTMYVPCSLPFASLGIISFTATRRVLLCGPGVPTRSAAVRMKAVLSGGQCWRYYISLGRQLWEDGALSAPPGCTSPSVLLVRRIFDVSARCCYLGVRAGAGGQLT